MFTAVCVALVAILGFVFLGPNDDIVKYGSFDPSEDSEIPERPEGRVVEGNGWKRRDVFFKAVDGTRCHGWFYLPASSTGTDSFPVIIMASGMGAQIDFGMDTYAEHFASQGGFACFLFDYRNFGSSEGLPRNLVDPWRHLDDWRSALTFLKDAADSELGGMVDLARIGLWGSSMSGGHVLVLASELGTRIKAVVSQSPHLDGRENRKQNLQPVSQGGRGLIGALRISRAAAQDIIRDVIGMSPAYIPIVGKQGSVSLMPLPENEMGYYYRKHPAHRGGGWQNMAPARLALKVGLYSPVDFVPKIEAPVLFVAAMHDTLCPASRIAKAAALCQVPGSETISLDCSHFSTYYDQPFQQASKKMVDFFTKHLK